MAETNLTAILAQLQAAGPVAHRHRFDPDHLYARVGERTRQRDPGPRMRRAVGLSGQGERHFPRFWSGM